MKARARSFGRRGTQSEAAPSVPEEQLAPATEAAVSSPLDAGAATEANTLSPAGSPAEQVRAKVMALFLKAADVAALSRLSRTEIAAKIDEIVEIVITRGKFEIDDIDRRNIVSEIADGVVSGTIASAASATASKGGSGPSSAVAPSAPSAASGPSATGASSASAPSGPSGASGLGAADPLAVPDSGASSARNGAPQGGQKSQAKSPLDGAKAKIQGALLERIDAAAAAQLPRKELARQISAIVGEILGELKIQLNRNEQLELVTQLLNDMLGLGPLEPLLNDDAITDIMVNGPFQVYVERGGKLVLTDVVFRNNAHVMNIATRIVSRIGRRIDESQPLVDARLEDGSRVNIIAPPLAIDGTSISIRKFSRQEITLDVMARQNNLSEKLAKVLKIASRCRLNVLISGGTGSGKTTLLNAMSRLIDHGERVVTIEDAAELQLQQPHVVRLETRPPNLEGTGEITMRDLVKNALRMRPDRIILGEIRGAEALDMLQAMNTGHDGSMSTIHANNPREALTRLENMVAMVGVNLPSHAVRTQIASAINLIVQVSRMRDGMRRITHVSEVTGMEGDIITMQELFSFEFEGEGADGKLRGSFRSSGLRPAFLQRAEYFGLGRPLLEAVS